MEQPLETTREYKAAKDLELALNDYGWNAQRFALATAMMHRTLQQTLFRTILATLRLYASEGYSTDRRNEATKEGSRRLLEVIDTLSVPFI